MDYKENRSESVHKVVSCDKGGVDKIQPSANDTIVVSTLKLVIFLHPSFRPSLRKTTPRKTRI